MNFKDFEKIMHMCKERNQEIQSREETEQMFEELGIEVVKC